MIQPFNETDSSTLDNVNSPHVWVLVFMLFIGKKTAQSYKRFYVI
ncbi:hypothetical protein MGWOODY_Mmi1524 [hydrothermal vent metagenome]|uniref:Uncharacterized protein n=1 Tax=hydrothermal vent metagenome TaxID=652676 RepID=A0A160VEZ1_9ZZZZ